MYNSQEFRKARPFVRSPEKLFETRWFQMACARSGFRKPSCVVQGSWQRCSVVSEVGCDTLKVADWHVHLLSLLCQQGSQEGFLS